MRRVRRKKFKIKFKVSPKVLIGLILSCVVLAACIYAAIRIHKSSVFRISEDNINCNIELARGIKHKIINKSLFTINIQQIRRQILKNNPEYKEVSFVKKFPASLEIYIEKREPIAQLSARDFFLLDKEGVVLKEGYGKPFTKFIAIEIDDLRSPFKKGDVIDDARLKDAFDLIARLKKGRILDDFEVKTINATNVQTLYFTIGNVKIVMGEGEWGRKIYVLAKLLKDELKDNFGSVKYIDLRYKKVYVGYKR
ncbi:MAG: FtsQ-type POTRA domain-containing protein [Candidatus Omnitrophota bacterium]|nr:MAG: FtsQ-type POTRA domain-containing protein [Candidatus Omnitrophota bacterium]